jgi:5-methyltetrahydrofolate--homocysteine methyltransferase
METVLKSASRSVVIAPGKPTVLIGERINPTGKKRLAAALRQGDLEVVRAEALAQAAAGADMIDVNVGTPGVDEVALLPRAVQMVMETVNTPISIDTANPAAMRAALETHRRLAPEGRALVNSVTGEAERLRAVLPLAAEFDAAVIALLVADGGIPPTVEGRLAVAGAILKAAKEFAIPPEHILVDCLAMTVGADAQAGAVTLEAIRRVRHELGMNLTLGASNVSHGLPEREVLNAAYLPLAIQNGVNCPIVDAAKVRSTILAVDLLLGRDNYAMRYIKAYKGRLKAAAGS